MTLLITPEGQARGCLPRRSQYGEMFPCAGERINPIPESQWVEGLNSIKPYVKTILSQGRVGSCAAECVAQALMTIRAIQGLPHVVLNPWSLYYKTSGGRDGGSNIEDNVLLAMEQGICPVDIWPRSKGWNATPSPDALRAAKEFRIREAFDAMSKAEAVTGLMSGMAFLFGAANHALCSVEYRRDYPYVANSWDVTWGEQGFGKWVAWSAINWGYGGLLIRA